MYEKEVLKIPEIIKYKEPVQNLTVCETIPLLSDYFDFLRKNQPGSYDFLSVGYVGIDEKGMVKSANFAIAEMLGVEKSQLLNKTFFDHIHKEDQNKLSLDANNLPDLRNQTLDIRLKKKDQLFWGRLTLILDDDFFCTRGQIGFFVFNIDDLKQVEQENEKLKHTLQQTQKMEAIGELSGGIAHDFNNILSAIMGFTELSLFEVKEESKLRSMLEKILKASNRAKELVRQILTFSHQSEYERRPLKLRLILIEVLDLIRASIPPSIDIKKDLQSNSHILADQTQMHQLIMNLCTNAWYAMKENGGTLGVTLKDVDICQEDQGASSEISPGRYAMLTIQDTGCGIRPELIEKIFDPYFTTKGKDKGTGLGLSVVRGIVAKCKGHIAINSQLGKGSEFSIYLPLYGAPGTPMAEKESLSFGNNERILFVDDEPFQTDLAEQLLSLLGYQVMTSNDSLKALDLFMKENANFDLVITDMVMPKMTGKTLAKKIFEIKPDMPIILCSGYSDDIDVIELKNMGITQYLMKPIGIKDMARAIKWALSKSRSGKPDGNPSI